MRIMVIDVKSVVIDMLNILKNLTVAQMRAVKDSTRYSGYNSAGYYDDWYKFYVYIPVFTKKGRLSRAYSIYFAISIPSEVGSSKVPTIQDKWRYVRKYTDMNNLPKRKIPNGYSVYGLYDNTDKCLYSMIEKVWQ